MWNSSPKKRTKMGSPMPPDSGYRRPRLLVAGQDQFGYLTDSYQYVLHLRKEFDVTYIGWDYGLPPITLDGAAVRHIPRTGNKLVRYAAFLRGLLTEIRRGAFDVIILSHFWGAGIYPLLGLNRNYIMDVRTGYVRASNTLRWLFNRGILIDSLMFPHVTVISASLGDYLHISSRKAHVLPLGAEDLAIPPKRFDSMRLLYVGSLEFRHIDRTVEGVARFMRENRGTLPITYDIVGFGPPEVEDALRRQIAASGCADLITFHGRVPYTALRPYLERTTIGIAFVPLVDHYQCQPATKLFEYLLAGMPALATSTEENARVITPANGVLIPDSAEGVYQGLHTLRNNLGSYTSAAIRASVEEYLWENIVAHNLRPYVLQLLSARAAAPSTHHDDIVPVHTEKGVP